jgi:hypothetical protein
MYKNDFKFTILFPDKFKQLWEIYGVNEKDLLASLTKLNLNGFNNPAKSNSWMAYSWDAKYFLKTVKIEAESITGSIMEETLEKDFFFQMNKKENKFTLVTDYFNKYFVRASSLFFILDLFKTQ